MIKEHSMIFDRFHDALDTLVALNAEHRALIPAQVKDTFSLSAFAREFCTISCDIGCQTGKTVYIKRRAKEGDLVVVFNKAIRSAMFRDAGCEVITAQQLGNAASLPRFSTIYVDEPKFVFNREVHSKFYDLLAHDRDQTFVVLGANHV